MLSSTTGTDASGKTWQSTDHTPWSRPQRRSSATFAGASSACTRSASAGAPGAGYSKRCSSGGKPPKSWIVRGRGDAVTAVPGTYQCAETASTAAGRGISAPRASQASV
jgi:hypothetical protein